MKLTRTKQCKLCPWKKTTNPELIPGYDRDLHIGLEETIAEGVRITGLEEAMACHESKEEASHFCVGWFMNQLRENNIPLRILAMNCENLGDVELVGEQHERFLDTLPKKVDVDA